MMLFMFFIVLLNIVAIALTYYCLGDTEKKDKLTFIAIGIAIMYMLTSFVYWLSSRGVEVKEISESGKDLITFMFVPINGILALPIFAKSYRKYKLGRLESKYLRNRGIVLGVLLLIVLTIECSYFKDIQNGVVEMLEQKTTQNVDDNYIYTNQIGNELQNEVEDQMQNEMQNGMLNEQVSNILETNNINNTTDVNEEINNNIIDDNSNVTNITN